MSVMSFDDFVQNLEKILPADTKSVAVAVSGGADSLALTLLTDKWAKEKGIYLEAFTVEHGLRPESEKEAQDVHTFLSQKGIKHTILYWKGEKPITRIEEKAREARYDLLLTACRERNISALFLGHHEDDQAETLLLRLSRGSGIDGLSAMAPRVKREDIWLIRPLLNTSHESLKAFLKEQNIVWAEDSSNQNPIYERVRFRKAKKTLSELGLENDKIGLSAKRLLRVKQALEKITDDFMEKVTICEDGYACYPLKDFLLLTEEIGIRVLCRLLKVFSSSDSVINLESAEHLYETLKNGGKATLCGCYIGVYRKKVFICAERARLPACQELLPDRKYEWGPFDIEVSRSVIVGVSDEKIRFSHLPSVVVSSLPCFKDEHKILCVGSLDTEGKKSDIIRKIKLRNLSNA
ncbi:MAG: tRNA lysidine(34) synthetase TilS [Alphaproteobacteria bacterium]|nr:tRNA lysidine(34) synthetase TilS [Alphaproteobacteria bacterium]